MTCYFCTVPIIYCVVDAKVVGKKSGFVDIQVKTFVSGVDSTFQLHLGKMSLPNFCKNKSEKAQSGFSKCFQVSNSIPSWKGKYSDHIRKDDMDPP